MLLVILFGIFLIWHGAIHGLWLIKGPSDPKWPFTTQHSPLLPFLSAGVLRGLSWVLVVAIVAMYLLAALGLWGVPGLVAIWRGLAIAASALSIAACAVFWNNQLVAGPVIDLAIIELVAWGWPFGR